MSRYYDEDEYRERDRDRRGADRTNHRRSSETRRRKSKKNDWVRDQKGRAFERRRRAKIKKIKTIFILSAVLIVFITTTVIIYKFRNGTIFSNDSWNPLVVDNSGGAVSEGTDEEPLQYQLSEVLTAYSDFAPGFKLNISPERVPKAGNLQEFIAIHYLGVNGENNSLETDGEGTHFYIYWDGTIYQAAGLDAITWHVGTAGSYTQIHPDAGNHNSIGIEMCAKCDGDPSNDEDPTWYFTEETQESCLLLTAYLMKIMNIHEDKVIRHGDIVDKWCPAPYFTNNKYKTSWTWDEFKAKLETVYRETDVTFPVQWEISG